VQPGECTLEGGCVRDFQEVEGLELSPLEAEVFDLAVATGELVLSPDVPVASHLEQVWWRHCLSHGLPYRVREVTWEEVERTLPKVRGRSPGQPAARRARG
jgi:hypothetical protein